MVTTHSAARDTATGGAGERRRRYRPRRPRGGRGRAGSTRNRRGRSVRRPTRRPRRRARPRGTREATARGAHGGGRRVESSTVVAARSVPPCRGRAPRASGPRASRVLAVAHLAVLAASGVLQSAGFPTRACPEAIPNHRTPPGVRDPDARGTPDATEARAASLRHGLVLAGLAAAPLLTLWTVATQVDAWPLPVPGAPWDLLVPVFAAAVLLLAFVGGVLEWAHQRVTDPAHPEDPGSLRSSSGPCLDCPG